MHDDLPVLKDELERKTVETLHQLAWKGNNHCLTADLVKVAAGAVWSVTAGLVSEETSTLAAELGNAGAEPTLQRHFVGQGKVLSIRWKGTEPRYVLIARNATSGQRKVNDMRPVDNAARDAAIDKLVASLKASGFIEL